MDLEEWEVLPVPAASADDTFLDFPDGDGENNVISCKFNSMFGNKSVIIMDYFICPSADDHHAEFLKPDRKSSQVIPVLVQLDPVSHGKSIDEKATEGTDQEFQDTVSQVHFKKLKETEFVDMKLDSPKSGKRGSPPPPPPQIDANLLYFEDKAVIRETKKMKPEKEDSSEKDEQDDRWDEKDSRGVNILKWGLSGIGAICSFGVAAVTVFVIASGHNSNHHHENEKIQFEVKDKSTNEVVHHATKLNEAISAVRGFPVDRAHITFGGYYERL